MKTGRGSRCRGGAAREEAPAVPAPKGSGVILSSCTGTEVFVLRFAVLFGSSMFVFLLIESGRNEKRENDRCYRHSPMKTTMRL